MLKKILILLFIYQEPAYTPQVEAISPTLPNEDTRQEMSPLRSSKDELLQNINKIDREILQTESQIGKLRKRQVLICGFKEPLIYFMTINFIARIRAGRYKTSL